MGKFVDLTGKTFNRLYVDYKCDYKKNNKIVYHCICLCGNELDVVGASLVNGHTKSCGCYEKEKLSMINKVDIANKRFGKLVALYENGRNSKNSILWHCRCDCGNYRDVTVGELENGINSCRSCARQKRKEKAHFLNFKDLTGQKFGRLTVLEQCGKRGSNIKWKCKCDCGNYKEVTSTHLIRGKVLSCGCYAKELNSKRMLGIRQTTYEYPQWFIDELYEEKDKQSAKDGSLVSTKKVKFLCKNHGIYEQRVSDHIKLCTSERRYSCPQCSNSLNFTGSTNENEIKDYVLSLLPNETIIKTNIIDLHDSKRKKEIDIYLPRLQIGIEYNGSAFHATENGAYNNKSKNYHQQKFLCAKEQGIHLITVFDKDYEENKWIILERIRHILLDSNKQFFIPQNKIEYTDNDYDSGEWIKDFGYHYIGQEEPTSFLYDNKYLVYRCGRTIWECDK